jgi:hypothetical protein
LLFDFSDTNPGGVQFTLLSGIPPVPPVYGVSWTSAETLTGNAITAIYVLGEDDVVSFSSPQDLASPIAQTPLPTALPLFGTGVVLMCLLGWRRKRNPKTVAV